MKFRTNSLIKTENLKMLQELLLFEKKIVEILSNLQNFVELVGNVQNEKMRF